MYRPLYLFGNNTDNDVAINYPLSPANPPVYSNGGKTVTVTMKGWKWSNGEPVDANSVLFFLHMAMGNKANWYAYAPGLLPDNVTLRHGQREHAHAEPQQGLLVHLVHLQPAGRAQPDAAVLGRHQPRGQAGQRRLHHRQRGRQVGQVRGRLRVPDRAGEDRHDVRDQPAVVGGRRAVEAVQLQHHRQRHDGAEHQVLRLPEAEAVGDQVRAVHRRLGRVHGAEDRAGRRRHDPRGRPAAETGERGVPATNPLGSGYTLEPFYPFGITYAQPNFNNPQVGFMVRQLYIRQALQEVFDQPGIIKAIWRGYALPGSGPAPNSPPGNQWIPPTQTQNSYQGPYPFNIAKAKSSLEATAGPRWAG